MPMPVPFVKDIEFEYGKVQQVTPLIRRVIANNPGPFTYMGTGTYIVGSGNVAVIDPGPLDEEHIAALLDILDGETITHQVITHTHRDHSPAAAPMKEKTSATATSRRLRSKRAVTGILSPTTWCRMGT